MSANTQAERFAAGLRPMRQPVHPKVLAVWAGCVLAIAGLLGCTGAQLMTMAQKPGVATGAGATFTGPTSAAQQSTQKASRVAAFSTAAGMPRPAVPKPMGLVPQPERPAFGLEMPRAEVPALPGIVAPQPMWVQEETETTFGAHQDVAAILKAALSGVGTVRWIGLVGVVLGVGGLLHSAGNHESGYPMVWILTTVVGAVLLISNNAWLCAAALVPLGLYGAQKLGLLRIIP